jgi:ankyrin repeat protein
MSEPRSLPLSPDLRRLRDEAKRRRKAGEFASIALAQLAIAREYGFRSWPRLKFHVEALTLDADERATALLASATSADLRRARALLDADPGLARHDLACACATGEAADVSRRVAAHPAAASDPTGPYGWAPILYACFSRLLRGDPERAPGIREVVRLLLAAGADPNAFYINDDQWLQVALYGAAGIAGDPEVTRMLLEAGADPTDDREGLAGNEVLYHACEFPDPTCAMLVIDAGCRQDFVDYDLGRALNFPNAEMVEMFCTHGARATSGHLHQAIWRRRPPRTVATLLDAGAPIDAREEHGLTPLQVAVRWGEDAVAALLRERGADESAVTDDDRALGAYLSGRDGTVPGGVALSALDEMMIVSIQGGHLAAMRRLLDAGARIDGDPDTDERPLGEACWRGRTQMTRELVDRGAALNFPGGRSAIGAALYGSRNCSEPEGGPSMRTVDEIPKEPYAEIVRILLAAGATVPERMGENGARGTMLIAELGVEPPA